MVKVGTILSRRWRDLSLTGKLASGFVCLFFLLVVEALAAFFALESITRLHRQVETAREIQRFILTMDRELAEARHLLEGFFLHVPDLGLDEARRRYARPAIQRAAGAVGLSRSLARRIDGAAGLDAQIRAHRVDLNLYLAAAERFAATAVDAVAVESRLAAPQQGLTARLDAEVAALAELCEPDPRATSLYRRLQETLLHQRLDRQRSTMQKALNLLRRLEDRLDELASADGVRRCQSLRRLALEVVTSQAGVQAALRDFALQEQMVKPVSRTLVEIAAADVTRLQRRAGNERNWLIAATIIAFLFTAGATAGVALLLHRSITARVARLTRTAARLRDGELDLRFDESGKDELGRLARVFATMTAQMRRDILELQRTGLELRQARRQLEDTVADRTRALRKLISFSRTLAASRDPGRLYRRCTSLSRDLLGFDYATLMLFDDQGRLVIADTVGFPEATIGNFALADGQGLATFAARERRPAVVEDFRQESRFQVPELVFQEGITSGLAVPITTGDTVYGVLIGHCRSRRRFTPVEVELLQNFADQAAVAVDNLRHLQALAASEEQFRSVFDNANDVILILDPDGTILEANRLACQRLGYSRDELLAINARDLVTEEYRAQLPARLATIAAGNADVYRSAHQRRDGTVLPVEVSATPMEFQGRGAVLVVVRDLSARIRMEEEMLKVKKLQAVGVLAGGIAHDFNNILAAILGNLDLARLADRDAARRTELMDQAIKACQRARGLTQQLLTFARGGAPVRTEASIAEVLRDSATFVLRGTPVTCTFDIAEDLWLVSMDAGQMSQVVQNLAINARQAMAEGGRLTISAANVVDPPQLLETGLPAGRYVRISVSDTGPGIPAAIIDQVFDPFFTTKDEGSGLGLAVTHAIVAKHDGAIFVDSSPAQGTTFTIYLPASGGAPAAAAAVSATALPRGSGRILVMDDEAAVRTVAASMLTLLGYQVEVAADGDEAVERYRAGRASGAPFAAVILDLTVVGGRGGRAAADEILAIDPAARVVVASGYADDPVMANYRQYGFAGALPKPFLIKDLAATLQALLSA